MCVFVGMDFGQPRRSDKDTDAEFFFKLALQSLKIAFACLNLATGKFPIASIRLALWARTEQVAAVLVEQNSGNHLHQWTCVFSHHEIILNIRQAATPADLCVKKTMSGLYARLSTNT